MRSKVISVFVINLQYFLKVHIFLTDNVYLTDHKSSQTQPFKFPSRRMEKLMYKVVVLGNLIKYYIYSKASGCRRLGSSDVRQLCLVRAFRE